LSNFSSPPGITDAVNIRGHSASDMANFAGGESIRKVIVDATKG